MIKYIHKEIKNPITGLKKWYVQMATVEPVEMNQICRGIESRTTLSAADVKGLADALQTEIVAQLQGGHSLRLGDLGSFRPTVKSFGVDTVDKVTTGLVKRVMCRFSKSGKMLSEFASPFRNLSFVKA